jgi:hypothetical protein
MASALPVLKAAVLSALFGAGLPAPMLAGPIADKAAEVEAMLDAGDSAGAAAAIAEVYAQVWEASPALGIRQAVLVTEAAAGVGVYNPRPTNTFKAGEPILIYAEPTGYGYGTPAEGLYAMGFGVDLKVVSETGEILGEIPDLTQVELNSRNQNREFQANITYTLTGIAPGRYVLQTTLKDKYSAKTGMFETAIEIIEGTYEPPKVINTTINTEMTTTGSTSEINTTIESNE